MKAVRFRIILEALNLTDNVRACATLEVDETIRLLVSAATETHRDATMIVATALRGLALSQRLDRLAFIKLASDLR